MSADIQRAVLSPEESCSDVSSFEDAIAKGPSLRPDLFDDYPGRIRLKRI